MPVDPEKIKLIVEAALLAADGPLTVANLARLFGEGELDEEQGSKQIREALKLLETESEPRGVELKRVASGYRYQVRQDLSAWVSRLWDEKPPRYTRALLETLALIAYKQPVTRGDIEQVRGVSISQNIMRTLVEREWIKVVGHKEVPGRPSLYATTREFLDYFNLKSLDELPPLPEIRALIEPVLEAGTDVQPPPDETNISVDGEPDLVEDTADTADASDTTEADDAATTNDQPDAADATAQADADANANADEAVADDQTHDSTTDTETSSHMHISGVSLKADDDAAVSETAEVVPLRPEANQPR